jgi:hypothetical protein
MCKFLKHCCVVLGIVASDMANLGHNLKMLTSFVQGLTKPSTGVRGIHLSKPKQHMLNGPLSMCAYLNPMSSDSKVSISVVSLPRITGQADLPAYCGPLMT